MYPEEFISIAQSRSKTIKVIFKNVYMLLHIKLFILTYKLIHQSLTEFYSVIKCTIFILLFSIHC